VLNRTLGRGVGVDGLYRPYRWQQGGRSMGVLFRDHFMSDLIGFVYSKMDAAAGGRRFPAPHPRELRGILGAGRDALVPIILDGENAWEYYDRNGRPFLRELYRRSPTTAADERRDGQRGAAADGAGAARRIFPGSWINANFDVWIGAEEDNQAWTQLLRARQTYDAAARGAR
jgi:alpha-amylase/alpha-mannosidase (GH57 family)